MLCYFTFSVKAAQTVVGKGFSEGLPPQGRMFTLFIKGHLLGSLTKEIPWDLGVTRQAPHNISLWCEDFDTDFTLFASEEKILHFFRLKCALHEKVGTARLSTRPRPRVPIEYRFQTPEKHFHACLLFAKEIGFRAAADFTEILSRTIENCFLTLKCHCLAWRLHLILISVHTGRKWRARNGSFTPPESLPPRSPRYRYCSS